MTQESNVVQQYREARDAQVVKVKAQVIIKQDVPVVIGRIPDKEYFRAGFLATLGFGCALPIAMTFATLVGVVLWMFFGAALLGALG